MAPIFLDPRPAPADVLSSPGACSPPRPWMAHTEESADAACCLAMSAAAPPLMSCAHLGSLGLYHMLPQFMMTSSECGMMLALRVSRMASFIWFLRSVPMKWCSLAYMWLTAVSGSSSANCFQASRVVLKFSPTFRHQMRLCLSTSVSRSSCSSKKPSSKFCMYSASIFVLVFSASRTALMTRGPALDLMKRFRRRTLPPASQSRVLLASLGEKSGGGWEDQRNGGRSLFPGDGPKDGGGPRTSQ